MSASFVSRLLLIAVAAAATASPFFAFARPASTESVSIPGLDAAMLSPAFWIQRLDAPGVPILDRAAIEAQNAVMRRDDPAIHSPLALPDTLSQADVVGWIDGVSRRPAAPRYTAGGVLHAEALAALVDALALERIPARVAPRFGLVVRRADLRAFPTSTRVSSAPGDTDIDRFQEDALFPGAPIAVLHESRDGEWQFVVSERYAAWILRDAVALGDRETVAAYVERASAGLVVTGATAHTVFTPDMPPLSALQIEMGVRVPRLDWPATTPVNGQLSAFAHVIELPVRGVDGALAFAPALVPRSADVAEDVLPYTRAHVINQAFKFLGERYGWGHAYNARDCSGFVSEIYRSLGVLLPRNTSAQAVSPALDRIELPAGLKYHERLALLREADVGDLVFIPGHVMMIIGHVDGEPWVIHDTAAMTVRGPDGADANLPLNGVVVTPMTPMQSGEVATIERITSIQRVR